MNRIYLIAFSSILYREIRRFMRIWVQTLLPPAISMSLYFIIFGKLVGSQIQSVHGVSYMEYIVPGLIMMAVITNSYANVSSSFFSAKFQRHIEELLVAPVPDIILLLGYVLGGVARGLAVGIIVSLVAALFVDLNLEHPFLMLSVIVLTALVFSLGGFINALFAKKFDDVSIIPTFVLTPLTYLGGVFYSVQLLPSLWQQISLFNPILYMVNAFRYAFLGISDIGVHHAILLLVALSLLLFGWALWLLKQGQGLRS